MKRKPRLVLATANPHKVEEIARMLAAFDIEVVTLEEYPGVQPGPETGADFETNATQKAEAVAAATGAWALADDSGLEVKALQGQPGVFSKRYSGVDATDESNNAKLLEELATVPPEQRQARFVTVMALARPGHETLAVQGEVQGFILEERRGKSGFGYDPLFFYPPFEKTFGELSLDQKNQVSHRAAALSAMRERIRLLLNGRAVSAPPGPAPRRESFLEYVEAIVIALIMALILREFFLEAFKIPTPSMSPTLRGQEKLGDRILVDKLIYRVREPRRWEVIVFHYPLNQTTNYIKRLIGLPGERVQILDGDIWINGRIERKPLDLQRHLWISLFPESRDPFGAVNPREYRRPGLFERPDRSPLQEDTWAAAPGEGKTALLRFVFHPEFRVNDRRRYEAPSPRISGYRDLCFEGEVTLAGASSEAAVRLRTRETTYAVRLRAGGNGTEVDFPREARPGSGIDVPRLEDSLETGKGRCLPVGEAVPVTVMFFDYQLIVEVDGEIWFRYVFVPDEKQHLFSAEPTTLGLELGGKGGTWAPTGVSRDLHHTGSGFCIEEVPEDSFFVLGDNSINSRDSRKWHKIQLRLKDGRVIEIEKDAPDRIINPHTGLPAQYTDILGNHYAPEEIDFNHERVVVSAPFVSRSLLIGRAFLIFFPWPPFYSREFRPGFIQ